MSPSKSPPILRTACLALLVASALATRRARQAVRRMGGDLLGDTSGSFRV